MNEYLEFGFPPRDEPGRSIEWVHKKERVYGHLLDGLVWEIGTLKACEEIDRIFSKAFAT